MPTPISTINAPNPAPTISPAKVPGGKPPLDEGGGGSVAFGESATGGGGGTGVEVLVTGGVREGEGGEEVVLGVEGDDVGDGDGGVAISGEDSIKSTIWGEGFNSTSMPEV